MVWLLPEDDLWMTGGVGLEWSSMASFVYRAGKPKAWLAQIKRKGHKTFSKSFFQKKDAEYWAREQERNIDLRGLPLTIEELKKVTVGDLVDRYLKEITPKKKSAANETLVLKRFRKHNMCKKTLASLSSQDARDYRNDRLNAIWKSKGEKGPGRQIQPSTVRRECNTLHHIFETARTEWNLENLGNPFHRLKIEDTTNPRDRRLKPDEQGLLEKAADKCRGDNPFFIQLAISLAIETGMRRQEIFGLKWGDVDTNTRRIRIRKSKTDHIKRKKKQRAGRTIVMTSRAAFLFVAARLEKANADDLVFPMTKDSFKQAWEGVVKRAGIEDLTFHDLRHEAASRFDEAGLTMAEHALMLGHSRSDMTSRYIHADLDRIQQKLDNYGMAKTFAIQRRRAA